ncbi:MAG: HEAT repeat domain-containing protein, partial [Bacteroidota bacterium]|nr:HEAT repeat domain-containing protein [Bacteroidota bacterium]
MNSVNHLQHMSIIELLSSVQGSKGSAANIALADAIAASGNSEAVKELVGLLKHQDRNIQSDSIKTLYEIGYRNPELIAPHCSEFLTLLASRNNRLVWGAMAAITCIVPICHEELFRSMDMIMEAVNTGSVITIDCGVDILAKLNRFDAYHNITDPLLMEQLSKCPIKQLPTYAGKALEHIGKRN